MEWEPTQFNILDDFRRGYALMKADEARRASRPPEPFTLIVSAGWVNHPDFAETRRRYEEAGFKVELYDGRSDEDN